VAHPTTLLQNIIMFPWKRYYQKNYQFRLIAGTFVVLTAGRLYLELTNDFDFYFTPYTAVHHSVEHKLMHDLAHERYPPVIKEKGGKHH